MKKKIVKERQIEIKLEDSRKIFKFKVANTIRLKELANQMSRMLSFDPYSTEWAFFPPVPNPFEIPIHFTLFQIELQYEKVFPFLTAKVSNVDVIHDMLEDLTPQLKPWNIKQRAEGLTKTVGFQINNKEIRKRLAFEKRKELFSVNGRQRLKVVNLHGIQPEKP